MWLQGDWESELDDLGECSSECEAEWLHEQAIYHAQTRQSSPRGCCSRCLSSVRRVIKALVEHKYFQQGILLAILVNTLSMGIEYHNQVSSLKIHILF